MKKIFYVIATVLTVGLVSCDAMFDELKPMNKTSQDVITSSEAGLQRVLANLYYNMPMEDFNFRQGRFNVRGWDGGLSTLFPSEFYTDNATHNFMRQYGIAGGEYWPYTSIRTLNTYMTVLLPEAKEKGTISEKVYNEMMGEAHFIRAYMYFGMVKRSGGVPLVTEVLDSKYDGGKSEGLYIPRSTEEATWDFVLAELDEAAKLLPVAAPAKFRASKYAALALQSRVALHAASVAKYNPSFNAGAAAVQQNLVGFANGDAAASKYYAKAISAAKEVITKGGFSLYGFDGTKLAADKAAENYQNIFLNGGGSEFIFGRGYAGETQGSSHSYEEYYSPHQAGSGYHKHGRYNPTLNLVDVYDNIDGTDGTIATKTSGNENYSVVNPQGMTDFSEYIRYADPTEPFKNKDPRFHASIVFNGAKWRGTTYNIYAGAFNGSTSLIYGAGTVTGADGNDYAALGGGDTEISGFFGMDNSDNCNGTTTGFTLKKFLANAPQPMKENGNTTTTYIDLRLAEVILNYAEAVVESNATAETANAQKLLNDIRKRAGMPDVALTLENVLKERRVELAFEGQRMWDMARRREMNVQNESRKALLPIQDLSGSTPATIYVRAEWYFDQASNGNTFNNSAYYKGIPNTNKNGLVPNDGI